jgi:tRNA(Ile)-lysidine synthase
LSSSIPFSDTVAPFEAAQKLIKTITKPARILIAVSGGSDSTGLLMALHKASAAAPGVTLHAVTIDHRLRRESADEALEVGQLCASLGIAHFIRNWVEDKPSSGISAASRMARYRLIGKVADEISATAIVTAHTHEDQLETIAMNAARSVRDDNAGLSGMAKAVLYDRRHWVVRPFLQCRRKEIRDYLTSCGVGWIDDPSNLDRKYERVRTRLAFAEEKGSHFASGYQPSKRDVLAGQAAGFLKNHAQGHADGLVFLDAAGLSDDPDAVRQALSTLAAAIGGRRFGLSSDSMDRIMGFVTAGKPGRMTASRTVFDVRREGLYLMRENRDLPTVSIDAGETAIWDGRYRIHNGSGSTMIVRSLTDTEAEDARGLFVNVPKGVSLRAARSMPQIVGQNGVPTPSVAAVSVQRALAPFDLFLPLFDLELASEIAVMLGRQAYAQPPV